MKRLKDILLNVDIIEVINSVDRNIDVLLLDSRQAKQGSLFAALRGTLTDGHNYIIQAVENGASAVVCEEYPTELNNNVCYIKVKDSSFVLGIIASNFYDNPSKEINLVGVTGTNGKTTIATLLYKLHRKLGYKTGLLSTIENKIEDIVIKSTHTTPDVIKINSLLREMVDYGCEYCFMEVSSHSIVQNRIVGLNFKGGIFTNITHDHLDYHKTFDNYIEAKKKFFDNLPKTAFALVNIDDKRGMVMLQNTSAKKVTCSLNRMADFKVKILENQISGLHLKINEFELYCKLIGEFNAYNLLMVFGAGVLLGHNKMELLTYISELNSVEGRFEYFVNNDNITAVVDYAHTPDALRNVLNTIKGIRTGAEQIITVVGCGGDRDKTKRPIMAKISAENSDKVILTSDNPRTEVPEVIINEMYEGVEAGLKRKVIKMTDRAEAIKLACTMSNSGDIILVAGKGHENYQEINGERFHFDDMEQLQQNLN